MTTTEALGTVKLRQSWFWRLVPLITPTALAIFYVVYLPASHGLLLVAILLLWSVFVAFVITVGAWSGVNLTPMELEIHSLHRRQIPWANVQAITTGRYLGGERVIVWTDRGERIPLLIPGASISGGGPATFEKQYHLIGQWWLGHRGPWWQPRYYAQL
jgi:hypothetical protein